MRKIVPGKNLLARVQSELCWRRKYGSCGIFSARKGTTRRDYARVVSSLVERRVVGKVSVEIRVEINGRLKIGLERPALQHRQSAREWMSKWSFERKYVSLKFSA